MVSSAWKSVKSKTIQNCFRKAFALSNNLDNILSDVSIPDNIERKEFERQVNYEMTMAEAVKVDFLTNDKDEEMDENENHEEEEEDNIQQVSSQEFFKALETVRNYAQFNGLSMDGINNLKKESIFYLYQNKNRQTQISSYFNKIN